MLDIVTMGEMLVQFNSVTVGPLRHSVYFEKHAAGAEANFAVGMARMGFNVGYITHVGEDEFGKYIISVLKGEGIDISRVRIDKEAPTGVYFIQRNYPIPSKSSVLYYRKGSAASRLSPEDVDLDYIKQAKLFHLSGITPALSESCKEASLKALKTASENRVMISFDTNIRLRLWSKEKARETLLPMLRDATIVLTEPDDAEILLGKREPEHIIDAVLQMGCPKIVVVKLGEEGAVAATEAGSVKKPAFKVPVVDAIGAGDAFAAGFISSIMRGLPMDKALEIGNAAGALVVMTRGDIENLPSMEDVEKFLAAQRRESVILR